MTPEQLECICRIANAPLVVDTGIGEAARAAGVCEARAELSPALLADALRRHPELVDGWLRYSDSKPSPEGWYLLDSPRWIVGYLESAGHVGHETVFDGPAEACAAYILRELDDALQLGPQH